MKGEPLVEPPCSCTGPAPFWGVIERSLPIERHLDYLRWLQGPVSEYLPHEVLITAWGNFADGRLHYDVASRNETRIRHALDQLDLGPLMIGMYAQWRSCGRPWFVSEQVDLAINLLGAGSRHPVHVQLRGMRSMLVYGIRDRRTGQDALYLFFDRAETVGYDSRALHALLPSIDATLRRIECAAPAEAGVVSDSCGLSDRESEILSWIRHGKTNNEIALILGISPNTVKNHVRHSFRKLKVTNRAQAAVSIGEPVATRPSAPPGSWRTRVVSEATVKLHDGR